MGVGSRGNVVRGRRKSWSQLLDARQWLLVGIRGLSRSQSQHLGIRAPNLESETVGLPSHLFGLLHPLGLCNLHLDYVIFTWIM